MWLLILEALLALGLLVFIVAWTMSGRRREVPALGREEQEMQEGPEAAGDSLRDAPSDPARDPLRDSPRDLAHDAHRRGPDGRS